jgi:myo-inositol-1-phosphate synthase
VVIDALRCVKLAKNNGVSGELLGPSAYFMKSPAIQYTDEQARLMVEEFIRENALGAKPATATHSNGHSPAEAAATVRDLPSAD